LSPPQDSETRTSGYLRVYSVMAHADCADRQDCDGSWSLDIEVTQTASDVAFTILMH